MSSGTIISQGRGVSFINTPIPLLQKIPPESNTRAKKVLILSGPTASGKTKLSLIIAKAIGGEIISADSMQIYKGMDIGTAKASAEEQAEVPHHLLDIRTISDQFNVVDFYYEAQQTCASILARDKIPIIVGGAGFYLRVFLYGPPPGPPSIANVRQKLQLEMDSKGPTELFERLKAKDPHYAETITLHDKQKIIRGLEIIELTGDKVSKSTWGHHKLLPDHDFRCWFLYRSRENLYKRIEKRCDLMLAAGFVNEVEELKKLGLCENPVAAKAIGYHQCLEYLAKPKTTESYNQFVQVFKQQSRHYAKRQFTWFRREPLFRWLDLELHDPEIAADIIMQEFFRTVE